MRYRHVIVDRDGVLNVEAPDQGYVTGPEHWRWIPGALEALAMLHRAGIRVSVATNQSGVGRGLMTRTELEAAARLPEGGTPVYDDLRTLAIHLLATGRVAGEPSG